MSDVNQRPDFKASTDTLNRRLDRHMPSVAEEIDRRHGIQSDRSERLYASLDTPGAKVADALHQAVADRLSYKLHPSQDAKESARESVVQAREANAGARREHADRPRPSQAERDAQARRATQSPQDPAQGRQEARRQEQARLGRNMEQSL